MVLLNSCFSNPINDIIQLEMPNTNQTLPINKWIKLIESFNSGMYDLEHYLQYIIQYVIQSL